MKIAFTSCFDAIDDSQQTVWDRVGDLSPDVLLLLGDSVYMDFGIFGERRNGWPRKVSDDIFATTLYDRYRSQWNVESFRRLLSSRLKLGMTWDDHDFAWNNSRGAGSEKRRAVSREKRLISRALFLQFHQTLENGASQYPTRPSMAELLSTEDAGIQSTFDIEHVRFIMLDGRSFREDPNDVPNAEMHGREQRAWLAERLGSWDGLKIIGAGTVLSRSRESWDQYLDYAWLLAQPASQVIVLTGDVHKNITPHLHKKTPPLYEITSSGAARPGLGGASGNFGILDIGDEVSVTLHSEETTNGSRFLLSL
jgi:phosphodiesterase/alkaline phosphatase D-like protein